MIEKKGLEMLGWEMQTHKNPKILKSLKWIQIEKWWNHDKKKYTTSNGTCVSCKRATFENVTNGQNKNVVH